MPAYLLLIYGKVFRDKDLQEEIKPYEDINGYLFIRDEDLKLPKPSGIIKTASGDMHGKYIHRMVVFAFGDRLGRPYLQKGNDIVIDHCDMNHKNNSWDNLEQITSLRNLWRAWYLTKSKICFARYAAERKRISELPDGNLIIEDFLIEKENDIKMYLRTSINNRKENHD